MDRFMNGVPVALCYAMARVVDDFIFESINASNFVCVREGATSQNIMNWEFL